MGNIGVYFVEVENVSMSGSVYSVGQFIAPSVLIALGFVLTNLEKVIRMNDQEKIAKAINIAVRYGGIDGDHHKAWVIDQMVRSLTDCPIVKWNFASDNGKTYDYDAQGESEEYKELVKDACDGEDGFESYDWDCGIAP